MIDDVVVDTNVFVHASNPENEHHTSALAFVMSLSSATAALCVDDGYDVVESNNRSLIGGEYNQHLSFGMVGYAVVATMAASGRVKQVTKTVPAAVRQYVRRLVPRNPRDRTFVHVAYNSREQILVSHDFDDFPDDVRRELRRQLNVVIQLAGQVVVRLSD